MIAAKNETQKRREHRKRGLGKGQSKRTGDWETLLGDLKKKKSQRQGVRTGKRILAEITNGMKGGRHRGLTGGQVKLTKKAEKEEHELESKRG